LSPTGRTLTNGKISAAIWELAATYSTTAAALAGLRRRSRAFHKGLVALRDAGHVEIIGDPRTGIKLTSERPRRSMR